jgi:methanogenic corrinoid protein MtbC1
MNNRLKIGISQGDTNGVGWEIILKIFADNRLMELFTPVVYGSSAAAAYYQKVVSEQEYEAVRLHAPVVGLSALMTTTVPAMEQAVRALHERAPWCKVIVGGAVLTEEYAARIGADAYAPDAMAAVRFAEALEDTLAG